MQTINWLACDLIESVPDKCGGQPVVVGTRIFPAPLVENYADGDTVQDIHESYSTLTIAQIQSLIAFAHEAQLRVCA